MADLTVMDGKTIAGMNGEGILIDNYNFKTETNTKTKEDNLYLEIGGVAHTYLLNPYSPEAGFKELPEPVSVTVRIDLMKEDRKIDFDIISRAFNLKHQLDDKEDEELRFTEDGKDSVYGSIFEKKAYFRAKLKQGNGTTPIIGDKVTDFFINLQGMPQKVDAKQDDIKAIRDRIKKKKAAKDMAGNLVGAGEPVPF